MDKNIKHFKKSVNEAIEFFGLYSYSFTIMEQMKPEARASNYYHSISDDPDSSARLFTICYSLHWINDEDTTLDEIRNTAFHEVFETMFYRLRDYSLANKLTISEREVDDQIHKIIRTFENKILPLIK